ncbi:MAG: 4-hydroxy-tetrahydrodipicolinate reductase [Terriglobales bacterium]
MNLLVLGKGKMGSMVIDLARQRGHCVDAMDIDENLHGAGLTAERLHGVEVVADFTWPDAVLDNVAACARAGKSVVVGTTGWYDRLPAVRAEVEKAGTGFVYGANFSIGVNLFFEVARTAAAALKQGFTGHITETHHMHKKDAPSGTAVKLQKIMEEASGKPLTVSSVREGEVVGIHEVALDAIGDRILLRHEAKSRLTFAEGAVRAAEWLRGKRGFYDFKDIFREV